MKITQLPINTKRVYNENAFCAAIIVSSLLVVMGMIIDAFFDHVIFNNIELLDLGQTWINITVYITTPILLIVAITFLPSFFYPIYEDSQTRIAQAVIVDKIKETRTNTNVTYNGKTSTVTTSSFTHYVLVLEFLNSVRKKVKERYENEKIFNEKRVNDEITVSYKTFYYTTKEGFEVKQEIQ